MTESEKSRMVKEVLLQATANNKDFQAAMARNAVQAPRQNSGGVLLANASTITIFGLATLMMLGLNLSGCACVPWVLVFLPIVFEWVMKSVVIFVNKRENEKGKVD